MKGGTQRNICECPSLPFAEQVNRRSGSVYRYVASECSHRTSLHLIGNGLLHRRSSTYIDMFRGRSRTVFLNHKVVTHLGVSTQVLSMFNYCTDRFKAPLVAQSSNLRDSYLYSGICFQVQMFRWGCYREPSLHSFLFAADECFARAPIGQRSYSSVQGREQTHLHTFRGSSRFPLRRMLSSSLDSKDRANTGVLRRRGAFSEKHIPH
jgi:hypothetical protein